MILHFVAVEVDRYSLAVPFVSTASGAIVAGRATRFAGGVKISLRNDVLLTRRLWRAALNGQRGGCGLEKQCEWQSSSIE